MIPERWQEIEDTFHAAAALPAAARKAFLMEACANDETLLAEVERLLASHETAAGFIEGSAVEVAAGELAAARADAMQGKVVGRYRILRLISEGGMGEVYLAEDTALGRKVALKVLLPAYADKDRDSLRRFQQEARAASALSHPNTAHIYEIGESGGANFIAMEYVEGQPLDARIDGHPLASIEIVDIGIQIADALEEAHEKGITHRDIKSANIIVTARGRVKVLDFGLAKSINPADESSGSANEALVKTRPGVVLGTISYMSPEQALARPIDTRTDIFSLGVVLYEMATGRLPFTGESVTDTIDKIAHAQPEALARFNYEVPPELERIVRKCLRKSRDERYQTARDLLIDLKNLKRELEFASQHETLATKPPSHLQPPDGELMESRDTVSAAQGSTSSAEYIVREMKRHKWGVALTLGLLIVGAIAITAGLRKVIWPSRPLAKTPPAMNTKRLITSATSRKVGNASISPDGKFVVYKDDEADGRQGLWIRQVATGAAKQIVPPDEIQFFGTTFSRDGNLIFYTVRANKYPTGALFQVPVIGGPAKQLMVNIWGAVTQSPDGKQIAYVYEKTLMIASTQGSDARPLASLNSGSFVPSGPSWSPDGKTIACGGVMTEGAPYASVFAIDVNNGSVKPITQTRWASIRRVVWLGDGSGLLLLAYHPEQDITQLWEVSYPAGQARRITNDANGHGHISLGLTADSRTLVTQQEEDVSNVWLTNTGDATSAKQLTSGELLRDGRYGITWGHDGRLVYANGDLWQTKAEGSEPSQLTNDDDQDQYPVLTRDGKTIVFRSTRSGGFFHIWRMGLDGSQPTQLSQHDNEARSPRLSPDNQWVIYAARTSDQDRIPYTTRTAEQERLWKVSINGGTPEKLTDYACTSPDVSPDGKLIACRIFDEKANPPRWRIAVIPFSGGPPLKTLDLPVTADVSRSIMDSNLVGYVRFIAEGREVAYVDRINGVSNIWSRRLDGGAPKQLTNFASGLIFNFEFSPDGKQIACARGTRTSDIILLTDFR